MKEKIISLFVILFGVGCNTNKQLQAELNESKRVYEESIKLNRAREHILEMRVNEAMDYVDAEQHLEVQIFLTDHCWWLSGPMSQSTKSLIRGLHTDLRNEQIENDLFKEEIRKLKEEIKSLKEKGDNA